jgi:hypothetical protein
MIRAATTILRPRFKNILEALLVFSVALVEIRGEGSLATKFIISPPQSKKKNILIYFVCMGTKPFAHIVV